MYCLEHTEELHYLVRMTLDLDGDGDCTIADAVRLTRILTEQQPDANTDAWLSAVDVNQDGQLDVLDVVTVLQGLFAESSAE